VDLWDWPNPLDTQNPSSYTAAAKNEECKDDAASAKGEGTIPLGDTSTTEEDLKGYAHADTKQLF
jgi:hypothetical protein